MTYDNDNFENAFSDFDSNLLGEIKQNGTVNGKKIPNAMLSHPKFLSEVIDLVHSVVGKNKKNSSSNIGCDFNNNTFNVQNINQNNFDNGFSVGSISLNNGEGLTVDYNNFSDSIVSKDEENDFIICSSAINRKRKIIDLKGIERAFYELKDRKKNKRKNNTSANLNNIWGDIEFKKDVGFVPSFPSEECSMVACERFDDSQMLVPNVRTIKRQNGRWKISDSLVPLVGKFLDKLKNWGHPIAVRIGNSERYLGIQNSKYNNMERNDIVNDFNQNYAQSVLNNMTTDSMDIADYIKNCIDSEDSKNFYGL